MKLSEINFYYCAAFCFCVASFGMLAQNKIPQWSAFFGLAVLYYLLGSKKR